MKNAEQFPFFVILHHQNGGVMPMVDDNEDLAMYETSSEAAKAAKNNPLGDAFGFEVFEVGCGETV